MQYFYTRKAEEGITVIEDCSVTKMYLIEGSQRALLVDTGIGHGDLKSFVETLTNLPVTVVLTHGHYDHIGGMASFEDVYLPKEDFELVTLNCDRKLRFRYARESGDKYCIPDAYREEDFVQEGNVEQLKELEHMQCFDLGGRIVTAVKAPGHTKGMVVLYDDLTRSMIIGDACNPSSYLICEESLPIKDYLQTVEELEQWIPRVKHFYISHDYGIPSDEIPAECILNVKACCQRIICGQDDAEPFSRGLAQSFTTERIFSACKLNEVFTREDGKVGNIVYAESKR